MTNPVEGGKVKFYPYNSAGVSIDALITKVWTDSCVNVEWVEKIGADDPRAAENQGDTIVHSETSVLVHQPGSERPTGNYCVLVDVETITAADVGDLSTVLDLNAGQVSSETLQILGVKAEQPAADDDHVAPGHSLVSDPTKFKGLTRLEEAHALQEVAGDVKPFVSDNPNHIQAFKAEDGRTMRVVEAPAGLAAQQA